MGGSSILFTGVAFGVILSVSRSVENEEFTTESVSNDETEE